MAVTRADVSGPSGESDSAVRATLVLDRYRLMRRLGSGAFGTVWSARDERLERDVAVKVLPRERVIHARFEREARAAARLQHPAIVTLYEAAVDDDGAYLVSELVRGRTLDTLLSQGKLSDREILEVGVSLCDALAHAHSQGVIHRDVKPSNVLVPSGAARSPAAGFGSATGARAKLTDFGVAYVVGDEALTEAGDVVGTLAYMAPEQADGRDVGPEADLYSLALVLYEALTGVNPQQQHVRQRAARVLPPLRRQRRDLGRTLAAGIDLALQPRPQARGSLLDLRATLVRSLGEADDTPGVVAGAWGADDEHTWARDEVGSRWLKNPDQPPVRSWLRSSGSDARSVGGAPSWPGRALNAVGAGVGAAWLCIQFWQHPPVPPALAGLAGSVLALLLPLAGSLLTALALGAVSLAAAFPAVVALLGGSWWRRGLVAGIGLALLVAVSRIARHNLYWLPAQLPPAHLRSLALVGVWMVAAAVQPLLRTHRFPLLDLMICVLWSVAAVMATEAAGARPLVGEVPGALLGTLLVAWWPLLHFLDKTRQTAQFYDDVA